MEINTTHLRGLGRGLATAGSLALIVNGSMNVRQRLDEGDGGFEAWPKGLISDNIGDVVSIFRDAKDGGADYDSGAPAERTVVVAGNAALGSVIEVHI